MANPTPAPRQVPPAVVQLPGACAFACLESLFKCENIAITQKDMIEQGGADFVDEKGSYKLGVSGLQSFLDKLEVPAKVTLLSINSDFPYTAQEREYVLLFSHRKGCCPQCGNHVRVYLGEAHADFQVMDPTPQVGITVWKSADWYDYDIEPCSIAFI